MNLSQTPHHVFCEYPLLGDRQLVPVLTVTCGYHLTLCHETALLHVDFCDLTRTAEACLVWVKFWLALPGRQDTILTYLLSVTTKQQFIQLFENSHLLRKNPYHILWAVNYCSLVLKKVKSTYKQVAQQARACHSFISMKRLGVFLLPPGWNDCLSQGYISIKFPSTHLCTWVERVAMRTQEHNIVLSHSQEHNIVPGQWLELRLLDQESSTLIIRPPYRVSDSVLEKAEFICFIF